MATRQYQLAVDNAGSQSRDAQPSSFAQLDSTEEKPSISRMTGGRDSSSVDDELLAIVGAHTDLQGVFIRPMLLPKDPDLSGNTPQDQASDPTIQALLRRHNDSQSRISSVVIEAGSKWVGHSDTPWPLRLEYDRKERTASLHLLNKARHFEERCEVHGDAIFSYAPDTTAVDINAFYLLIFRKYAPAQFDKTEQATLTRSGYKEQDKEVPVTAVSSPNGTRLWFDTQTGLLLQAELPTPQGPVRMEFHDYTQIEKAGGEHILLPTLCRGHIPKGSLPGFYLNKDFQGVIELAVEPAGVDVR